MLIGIVNAAATYTEWVAYGDAFMSTNDTYTVIKWNTTGARSPWNATGNVTSTDSVSYVVVGGGGGGGYRYGTGGGGAGAFWEGTLTGLSGTQTVTVGAGGAEAASAVSGDSGGNSVFGSVTANGGSGGASRTASVSLVIQGGSAGGGGAPASAATGASNTSNQAGHGNSGGTGVYATSTSYSGGAGGSAWGVGSNAATVNAGDAGEAAYTNITGTLITLAGGGGGGTYSTTSSNRGGGGSNATTGVTVGGLGAYRTTAGTDPTASTGSGGGGAGSTASTGTSGSGGIVIIRFPKMGSHGSYTSNVSTGVAPLAVQFTDTSNNTPTSWSWSYYEQNMLKTNQATGSDTESNLGGNITGNSAGGETVTSSTEQAWEGSRSIKVAGDGKNESQGVDYWWYVDVDTSSGFRVDPAKSYTFSEYVKGTGNFTLFMTETDIDGNALAYVFSDVSFQATSTWTRYNVTSPLGTRERLVLGMSTSDSLNPFTAYVDGAQLEMGSVPTAWEAPPVIDAPVGFSTTQNPSYTFTSAGNYTIYLLPTNIWGPGVWKEGWVNVTSGGGAAPVSSFTVNRPIARIPQVLTFTNTSTNIPTGWNWSWGDGTWTNGTTNNPTHKYTKRGIFPVFLLSSNAYGNNTSATQNIRVVGYENLW